MASFVSKYNLTLREEKGGPLSHEELDNNFRYFDSATTYLEQADGIEIDSGGLTVHNGDINLENGNLRYNPKLEFFDLVASSNTMVFDSAQSVLIGTDFNPNSTRFRVSGTGNQKYEVGCATSVSGQEVFQQMGPADVAGTLSGGIKSIQKSANAWDWTLALVSYNPTDGHQNAIEIDNSGDIDMKGDVTFNGTAEFKDSASFENGIKVENGIELNSGDLNINSGDLNLHGGDIHLDSGFTIILEGIDLNTLIDAGGGLTIMDSAPVDPTEGDMWLSPLTNEVLIWDGSFWFDFPINLDLSSFSDDRITDTQITYWDTAYGWGDHSTAGYIGDAPNNANTYGRKGAAWVTIPVHTASNGVGLTGADFSMTGAYTGNFAVTGKITASADVVAFSDESLKENVETLDGSKVFEMRGVSYTRVDQDGRPSSGVIAQELEQIAPELVTENEDGIKGVAYGNTIGYLIESIKLLKAEIEELKKGR